MGQFKQLSGFASCSATANGRALAGPHTNKRTFTNTHSKVS